MRFQILSHAGIMVEHEGVQVLSDPWLIGSTYWRSWWNYPPVSRELINSLKPDAIYLTHIHWDHFQGPSLKLFPRETKMIVPRGHFDRMKRDLNHLGFHNVQELRHGESVQLAPNFKLTSYSFALHCDSAVVFESPSTTLLNLNDCKIMGPPLRDLLRKHKKPDFVFASHSSANSRSCFVVTDDDEVMVDDVGKYIERFYQFAKASGAKYAVPCASNQCYLHKDTFAFNSANRTPMMVKRYWEMNEIADPELKVMVSGDQWSEESGFEYGEKDWFTNREQHLLEYQQSKSELLQTMYEREDNARMKLRQMERFFTPFFNAVPWPVRRKFRDHPIVYVLSAAENRWYFKVDIYNKQVTELESVSDEEHPLQLHISAFVMRHAMAANIMAHLGIGKRIEYRVTKAEKKYAELFKDLLDAFEYENLPLHNNLRWRSASNWASRWRELLLYSVLIKDKVLTGELQLDKHLVPAIPAAPDLAETPAEDQDRAAAHG